MRLNRLDLIRYGRFQDAVLALPRPDNAPDVTLIYGPNEAGKSTAFQAFLELLFGMRGGAHPYAFRFERSDLLVGAELDLPSRGPIVLRRNSKRAQTLLDAEERPVDEAILRSALHGLTRDAFVERFSLDDASLRAGGERIARAQGDLGQLLHAGMSGLTGLSEVLAELESAADGFHRKGGRGTVLRQGKDRLDQIRRLLRDSTLTEQDEARLAAARDTAQAAFAAADAALIEARARLAAGQAAQVWHEAEDRIVVIDAELAALPEGPVLPAGAEGRISGHVATLAEKAAQIEEAQAERERLQTRLAGLETDPAAGPLAAALARFDGLTLDGAPLSDRASTAAADLSKRRKDRDGLAAALATELAALDVPPERAAALILPSEAFAVLETAVEAANVTSREAKRATEEAERSRAAVGPEPPKPLDLDPVARAFEAWQAVADLGGLRAERQGADARLTQAAAGLPRDWQGLVEAGLPAAESLQALVSEKADLVAARRQAERDHTARTAERDVARAERAAFEDDAASVDGAEIEATRRARDAAWARHRATLAQDSAEDFEAAMLADDAARARFLTGAEARQQRRATGVAEARAQAQLETAQVWLDAVAAEERLCDTKVAKAAESLGLPQGTAAEGLLPRLAALGDAATRAADLRIAATALAEAEEQAESALADLTQAAEQAGLRYDVDRVGATIGTALATREQVAQVRRVWDRARQQSERLETLAKQAREAASEAAATLEAARAGLPLSQDQSALRDALPGLRRVQTLNADLADMRRRVAELEGAIAAVTDTAGDLVSLGAEAGPTPLATLDAARQRVAEAQSTKEQTHRLEARMEDLRTRIDAAQIVQANAQQALDDAFAGQGGSECEPLARLEILRGRDALRAERRREDEARALARGGVAEALFQAELAQLPDATRAGLLHEAVRDAQSLRDRALEDKRDAERAYSDAFAADLRADLVAEAAALTEDLRDGARAAAVARLGARAARGALRRLAAERRSTMVRDVERAFVAMTAPKWRGVDVWTEESGEKLVGIEANGDPVPAQNMSTGTMGQLYFALRLAGYRGFARDPGPLPMILDDIMETFDDRRAVAALKLCAEIGTVGQAIMFTHHAHLVTLAREALPGVCVVPLPD